MFLTRQRIASRESSASHVKNHTRAKYEDKVYSVHVPARLVLLFNFSKQNSRRRFPRILLALRFMQILSAHSEWMYCVLLLST